MDKESKSSSGNMSGNGIMAVMLLAAGVLFVREAPLQTTRPPANEPRLEQQLSLQDVDARLWQDPFAAIAKARAEARKTRTAQQVDVDEKRRTAAALAADIHKAGKQVEILAVMLPGGPYAENIESRRRWRYAVLAGLNASRMTPEDTEHLGYFFYTLPPRPSEHEPPPPQPPVAYEWFEPATDVRMREAARNGLQSRVLVMWLHSEAFAAEPLWRIAQLAQPFARAPVSWRVIGPIGSDGLKALVDEAKAKGFASALPDQRMRFYSPYATVPDRALLEQPNQPPPQDSVAEALARHGVMLVRTTGDDAQLADGLIRELGLRGLVPLRITAPPKPGGPPVPEDSEGYSALCGEGAKDGKPRPSTVAVVAEWDTLYGRSLRREFRAKRSEAGFCVERFNYVRGLDGQIPTAAGAAANGEAAAKPPPGEKEAQRRSDGTFLERAEGQGQFDYLRRLALQMRERDQRVRRTSADGQGLRAIGVLGNDVHDKLLVLQALQPSFPDAIFFTTDMDARFLHPREQPWARNLVVASNFGLRLTDSLQGGTPPFRDSYQTSAFLSTRLAMDDARRATQLDAPSDAAAKLPRAQGDIAAWFDEPRIFEIGRTAAFDFRGRRAGRGLAEADLPGCRGREWVECEDIHPPGSRRYPEPGAAFMFLVFAVAVLLVWAPALAMARGARRTVADFLASGPNGLPWIRWATLAAVFALVQLLLPLWLACQWPAFAQWLTHEGKPMLLVEGLSIWPTEAIRVFTLLLCLYLLLRGWLMLGYNLAHITAAFDADEARRDLSEGQEEADKFRRAWRRLVQMFSTSFEPSRRAGAGGGHGMTGEALAFWNRHIVQDRLAARLVRTTTWSLGAIVLSCLVMMACVEPRFVPQRGTVSLDVHEWLRLPALAAMYFLVFFVVDATVLCVRFVRGLRRLRNRPDDVANWPETTLERFRASLELPVEYLGHWIDLQFIALRTCGVTRLIYYPFIVISLWLLSRSAVFDRWTLGLGVVAPAILGASVALGCAVALRLAAEASRSDALASVRNALIRTQADPDARQPTAEQLELLQGRIERLHVGAFAPFWQQPLLKAVLLPFATLGGTTALDYLALANI